MSMKRKSMFDGTLSSPRQRLHAWLDGLFKDHALFRLVWTNLAPVIPGRVWRSNHPTPSRLRRWRKTLGLKTVFNLRGHRRCGADALGREMCQHIGLPYLDMAFESRNAPHKDRILRFHSLYKQAQFPLLLHCKSGADRTGLASGLIILFEGGTAEDALKQLHWRFLHFRHSRTGVLDAFFLLYQKTAEGHLSFLDWLHYEYDEDALRTAYRAGTFSHLLATSIKKS